jgi:hypothetical protein
MTLRKLTKMAVFENFLRRGQMLRARPYGPRRLAPGCRKEIST